MKSELDEDRGSYVDLLASASYLKAEIINSISTDLDLDNPSALKEKSESNECSGHASLDFTRYGDEKFTAVTTEKKKENTKYCSSMKWFVFLTIIISMTLVSFCFIFTVLYYRDYYRYTSKIYDHVSFIHSIMNDNEETIINEQFPMNVSSFFLKRDSMLQENEIPLLLLPDANEQLSSLSNLLSECIGVKKISLQEFIENGRYQVCKCKES